MYYCQQQSVKIYITHFTIVTHGLCFITIAFQLCFRVQVNQDGLKLNGTHQLLVYAADVNILGGSVHTVKKNAEALVIASKETGLKVNADKIKYMVMSYEKSAG